MARIDDVILIRKAALAIMSRRGKFQPLGPESAKICKIGAILIAYRTPNQKVMALHSGSQYGLDVWDGKKMFSIIWDCHDEAPQIVKFRRGDWEATLLNVGSQVKELGPLPPEWC